MGSSSEDALAMNTAAYRGRYRENLDTPNLQQDLGEGTFLSAVEVIRLGPLESGAHYRSQCPQKVPESSLIVSKIDSLATCSLGEHQRHYAQQSWTL